MEPPTPRPPPLPEPWPQTQRHGCPALNYGFVTDILKRLAVNGFLNIIILNGRGGPQTAVLNDIAEKIGREHSVRTLVVNWWSYCSDITFKTFGEDGGHAGVGTKPPSSKPSIQS